MEINKIIWWIIFAIVLIIIGTTAFRAIMHVKEVYTPTPKVIENPLDIPNGCGDGVTDCKG